MFATVCTMLAIVGHVVAGRAAVAPRAVVLGFVALYLLAWVLTGTERALGTILGGLLGGQFMLHALFAAAASAASATAPAAAAMAGAHSMRPVTGAGAMTAEPAADVLGGGPAMTLAHVAAALVAAWWLRRGERAAWTLARRTAALAACPLQALRSLAALADATALGAVPAPAGRPYDSSDLIGPTSVTLRGPVTRRGPPFGSTSLTYG
jgi:hypothetical protein